MDEPAETVRRLGVVSALIVDDNAFDRRRLRRIADQCSVDFFLREADDPQSFERALNADKFDVMFIDLDLTGSITGLDLVPFVRAHQKNSDAALIMIAGADHSDAALSALRAGFADYIDKDSLSPASLERASVNAVQKQRLARVADQASAQTQTIEAVLTDFATVCRKEMRPILSRMLRQVRQVRSELSAAGITSQNIAGLENTCARMDEFFQDFSGLANDGRLAETLKHKSNGQSNGSVARGVGVSDDPMRFARNPRAARRATPLFGQ